MREISKRRQMPADTLTDENKKKALYQEVYKTATQENLTPAWYLSDSRYIPRPGNIFKVYYSGEDVFADIAESMLHAKKSVDIVCTFFDPAMLLTRNRPLLPGDPPDANKVNYSHRGEDDLYSAWSERDSFGGIIIEALRRNPELKIRLVIWLHLVAQKGSKNIIGVNNYPSEAKIPRNELATGIDIEYIPDPNPNWLRPESWGRDARKYDSLKLRSRTKEAEEYSQKWFQRVAWEVEDKKTRRHSLFDRLCITRRAITTPSHSEITEEDARVGIERFTLEFGCDHQKTVLVDLDDVTNAGSNPHGYVLGHNYFTQYWSHFPFVHRDPRSEMDYAPYHDFSMQIKGPLLIDLNHNFCQAYGLTVSSLDQFNSDSKMQRLGPLVEGRVKFPSNHNRPTNDPKAHYDLQRGRPVRTLENESPAELYGQRVSIIPALYAQAKQSGQGHKAQGQVVRTRPDQKLFGAQEKEIKDAYLQVVRHANNYIFLVNQYFQYNRLARQIKDWKQIHNDAFSAQAGGKPPRTLYLFLGTCKSEQDGMVFRTQQMANEFGVGDQFETAFDEMYDKEKADSSDGNRRPRKTKTMEDDGGEFVVPAVNYVYPTDHITSKDMENLYIKPLLFMFYTQIPPRGSQRKNPADHVAQEVYVHAKLMVQDDAFFTLGSANTNIRSFAVDSELNIISDDYKTAQKTRHDLLKAYVGNIHKEFGEVFPNDDGVALTQAALEKVYKLMKQRMNDNYEAALDKLKPINGLIVRFHDDRTVDVKRVA